MRILVISDSHGNLGVIDKILELHQDVSHVFFLGDNVSDIENFELLYSNKKFYIVSGNCDYISNKPYVNCENICGKKILYTHGHTFNVKFGIGNLLNEGKKNKYDIILYGHTHVSQILYEDGIYIVNPGSCSRPRDFNRSYAVIDITDNGIMPIIMKI